MFDRKARQVSLFEDATLFSGVRLDPGNKWVKIARLISREYMEALRLGEKNPWNAMRSRDVSGCVSAGTVLIL